MVQPYTTETHMFVKIYWVPELSTGDNVTILIFKQKGVGKYGHLKICCNHPKIEQGGFTLE